MAYSFTSLRTVFFRQALLLYAAAALPVAVGIALLSEQKPVALWMGGIYVWLLSTGGIAAWLSAQFNASLIRRALTTADAQLHHKETGQARSFSRIHEINELFRSIGQMRDYILQDTLPKQACEARWQWHAQLLSSFLMLLRQYVQPNSPLALHANDYMLLQKLEESSVGAEQRRFNISELVNEMQKRVRDSYPVKPQVHLTVSLQSGVPEEWLGQPEALEALLRHLLLIALRRTQSGVIILRLEINMPATANEPAQLTLKLEDSGPPLPPGEWQQWLENGHAGLHALPEMGMVPWFLTGRLFQHVSGQVKGESTESGLSLTGSVPLGCVAPEVQRAVHAHDVAAAAPLIIAIEPHAAAQAAMARAFTLSGGQVFFVENYQQALDWAPTLPCAAVLLPLAPPAAHQHFLHQLRQLSDNGWTAAIACWAQLMQEPFIEFDQWRQSGVDALLISPLQPEALLPLCAHLPPCSPDFYWQADPQVLQELPPQTLTHLPELQRTLAAQLLPAAGVLDALARNEAPHDITLLHNAKSAALALGHMRLAALMDNLEIAAQTRSMALMPYNASLLADYVKEISAAMP